MVNVEFIEKLICRRYRIVIIMYSFYFSFDLNILVNILYNFDF